ATAGYLVPRLTSRPKEVPCSRRRGWIRGSNPAGKITEILSHYGNAPGGRHPVSIDSDAVVSRRHGEVIDMGVGRCLSMAATQYAEVDNLNLAYQVYGSGPVDLAYVPRLHNHVERSGTCWASPSRWTASPGSRASSRSTSAGAACRTRWPRRQR